MQTSHPSASCDLHLSPPNEQTAWVSFDFVFIVFITAFCLFLLRSLYLLPVFLFLCSVMFKPTPCIYMYPWVQISDLNADFQERNSGVLLDDSLFESNDLFSSRKAEIMQSGCSRTGNPLATITKGMLEEKKGAYFDEKNSLTTIKHGVDLLCFGFVCQPVAQETLHK